MAIRNRAGAAALLACLTQQINALHEADQNWITIRATRREVADAINLAKTGKFIKLSFGARDPGEIHRKKLVKKLEPIAKSYKADLEDKAHESVKKMISIINRDEIMKEFRKIAADFNSQAKTRDQSLKELRNLVERVRGKVNKNNRHGTTMSELTELKTKIAGYRKRQLDSYKKSKVKKHIDFIKEYEKK